MNEENAGKILKALESTPMTAAGVPRLDRAELILRNSMAKVVAAGLPEGELRTSFVRVGREFNRRVITGAAETPIATVLSLEPVPIQVKAPQPEQVLTPVKEVRQVKIDAQIVCACGKLVLVEGSNPVVPCECGRVFFAQVLVTTAGPEVESE